MLPKLRNLLKPKSPPSQPHSRPTTPDVAQSAESLASPDELFREAQSLHQAGQLENAIALYTRCIERAPDRAEAFYKRANALNSLGRPDPALEDYDRAISLNPSYAYA